MAQAKTKNNAMPVLRILMILWATLLLILLLMLLFMGLRPFLFHPLGDYPTQHIITPDRDAAGLPQVHLKDGAALVAATKCASDTVMVLAEWDWVRRGDDGDNITASLPVGTTVAKRTPGCQTIQYKNVFPQNLEPGIWRITGVEIAKGDGLWLGVSQSKEWETEPFRVAP